MSPPALAEQTRRYRAVDGFFLRPRRWGFVEVADVDVDENDNVYVFNRSPRPVMVFDKHGTFVRAWGEMSEHYFCVPHGITVGPDGHVFTADTGDHTVRKWTADGRLLMTLGTVNINSPEFGGTPFNKPTQLGVASNGDLYISDGYNNACVHCYDGHGNLKFSWGRRGTGPGEFDLVHSLYVDRTDSDKVYVADRYNDRVQCFSPGGDYLFEWRDLVMPNCIRRGPDGAFYIAEMAHRVTVCDASGSVLARWGDDVDVQLSDTGPRPLRSRVVAEPGAGRFAAPHGIAADSEGSVYVADVAESVGGLDRGNRSVQKFMLART
jgi:DNA-binding beta-propeller fold protein YncE